MGVFATRSGFRPNPIGLSAVELTAVRPGRDTLHLHLNGIDLLDGTPVLDIKPYLPYADSIPGAGGGFAAEPPANHVAVTFSEAAESACARKARNIPHLRSLIIQMLQTDPRPAYYGRKPKKDVFGMRIFDLDVRWAFREGAVYVLTLEEIT